MLESNQTKLFADTPDSLPRLIVGYLSQRQFLLMFVFLAPKHPNLFLLINQLFKSQLKGLDLLFLQLIFLLNLFELTLFLS